MDNNNLTNTEEQQRDLQADIKKSAESVIRTISGVDNRTTKKVLNNVISFMSSAGGAGASTLVATVAEKMKKRGYKVIIIDLNIMYPSQQIYLGIEPKAKSDLLSYLTGRNNLGASIIEKNGISLMIGLNQTIAEYIISDNRESSKMMEEAINRLSRLYDVVLIDAPNQIDYDIVNTALYKSDSIYMVMDDGVQSLLNIPKIINNFELTGIHTKKIKYVMNKRTSFHYVQSNLDQFNIKLCSVIPFETGVLESGLRGELFTVHGVSTGKTSHDYVKAIEAFTDTVLEAGGAVGE